MNLLTRVDSFSSKREAKRLIGRRVQQGQRYGTVKGIVADRTGIRLSIAWDGGLQLSWVEPGGVQIVAGKVEDVAAPHAQDTVPHVERRMTPPQSFRAGRDVVPTYAAREIEKVTQGAVR
jgi:hypothetical protein